MVQRNAMRAWKGEGDFRALLGEDADVSARLPPETLDACFDLTHALRHVDAVITRAVEASR
jgi:adenylosuccinate lyase